MKARFIEPVGKRKVLGVMWDGACTNSSMLHVGKKIVKETRDVEDKSPCYLSDYEDVVVPCSQCGALPPKTATRFMKHGSLYNTVSGDPEPGDIFWSEVEYPENFTWDGPAAKHLHAILPNGDHWDMDGRACNCTMPDDRKHRCWVRHGDPPDITVGKDGVTCSAGAGSIQSGNYHGFLINGEFTNA